MHTEYMPEELKKQIQGIFDNIRAYRERYFQWIKEEIDLLIGYSGTPDQPIP
jgi:hypothetical protein